MRKTSTEKYVRTATKTKCFLIFIGLSLNTKWYRKRYREKEGEKGRKENRTQDIRKSWTLPYSSCSRILLPFHLLLSFHPRLMPPQKKEKNTKWKLYNICLWIYRRIYSETKLPASLERWNLQFNALWCRSMMANRSRKLPSCVMSSRSIFDCCFRCCSCCYCVMSRQSSRVHLAVKWTYFYIFSSSLCFHVQASFYTMYALYTHSHRHDSNEAFNTQN